MTNTPKPIPVERAQALFEYRQGKLYHRQGKRAGQEAGGLHKSSGRWKVSIDGQSFQRSRVTYAVVNGKDVPPGMVIDHVNDIRTDDRIENLQAITPRENLARRLSGKRQGASSPFKGVRKASKGETYVAEIRPYKQEKIYLMASPCQVKAAYAYDVAASKINGRHVGINGVAERLDPIDRIEIKASVIAKLITTPAAFAATN